MSDVHQQGHVAGGHEQDDINSRPILLAAVGILIGCVVSAVAMWLLMQGSLSYQAKISVPADPFAETYGRHEPPAPRLQTEPIEDLEHLRAREKEVLTSYGWANRDSGSVRIPIERAMELVAKDNAGKAQ